MCMLFKYVCVELRIDSRKNSLLNMASEYVRILCRAIILLCLRGSNIDSIASRKTGLFGERRAFVMHYISQDLFKDPHIRECAAIVVRTMRCKLSGCLLQR